MLHACPQIGICAMEKHCICTCFFPRHPETCKLDLRKDTRGKVETYATLRLPTGKFWRLPFLCKSSNNADQFLQSCLEELSAFCTKVFKGSFGELMWAYSTCKFAVPLMLFSSCEETLLGIYTW
jgi:hypothetical protein